MLISILIGTNWKSKQNGTVHHLDTVMFLGSQNDTMYFVINENGDTVDWFTYWDGKKLDRGLCDYLNSLANSLKEE